MPCARSCTSARTSAPAASPVRTGERPARCPTDTTTTVTATTCESTVRSPGRDPVAPHLLEESRPAEDDVRRVREAEEEVELRRGQVHVHPVAADAPASGIDQGPEPDRALVERGRPVRPAQERPDPRHELADAEGLAEVVVGADAEADLEVRLGVARGQHEHRHAAVALDPAADLEAVQAGEHEVEDDDVRLESAGRARRRPARRARPGRRTPPRGAAPRARPRCPARPRRWRSAVSPRRPA